MESALARMLQPKIEALKVLIVDDDQYMRKVVRTMLSAIGVKTVLEANDGASGLEALKQHNPDIVICDWEMPMVDGSQFVRMVRSPGEFSRPDVPIIMLSGHGDRWRVVEAARIGAHEYLLKPVSTKALQDRIVTILGRPRPTVKLDGYYGPAPRRLVVLDMDEGEAPVGKPPARQRQAPPEPVAPPPPPQPVVRPAIRQRMFPKAAPAPQPLHQVDSSQSNLGRRNGRFQFWR